MPSFLLRLVKTQPFRTIGFPSLSNLSALPQLLEATRSTVQLLHKSVDIVSHHVTDKLAVLFATNRSFSHSREQIRVAQVPKHRRQSRAVQAG